MKLFIFIAAISLLLLINYLGKLNRQEDNLANPTPTPVPLPISPLYPTIETENGVYSYLIEAGISADRMRLENNTQSKKDTKDLMIQLECTAGINGGFYGTDDRPLGWMAIDYKEIAKEKKSDLLNGFVSI